jgi:aspartate kinase
MITVTKFGGSSVSNATQFAKIKEIVLSDSSRTIVVTSALGKDDTNKSKITDLLFLLYAHVEYGVDFTHTLQSIEKRFVAIRDELQIDYNVEKEITIIEQKLQKNIQKDYLVSRGEYITAKMLAIYLDYTFVDAKDVIIVNYNGTINYEKTEHNVLEIMEKNKRIVVPGFYAGAPNGLIKLFSRGGSDLTGSILSKAINADKYENWTDVDGLYVVDPTIIKNPAKIDNITYDELRELSYRGAQVLHQESVVPLEDMNIPIYIKNTNNPQSKGTKISNTHKHHQTLVTGIAGNKNYTSFNIKKTSSSPIAKVLKEVLSLFVRYKVNIEHIPTGIDTLSVITKTDHIKDCIFDLIDDIQHIQGITHLSLEDDIALIAIVGKKMNHTPGVSGQIFSSLGEEHINIKIIAQASSEISIIIGVPNNDYEKAVQTIYHNFY